MDARSRTTRRQRWSHPAVYHAGAASDWFFLASSPEKTAFPVFERHYRRLCELVDAGFGQRRKMLRRSLAGLVDESSLEEAGISPTARAEDLPLHRWAHLVRVGE
jgi:16S rRNA A1518/A1519 N6-dimethyltransferase RsmA/KsgA/DIM1 with predicted DNA glycosylase/AP lyase activity